MSWNNCSSLDDFSWPEATVLVPARNEATHVAQCFRSLADMDYPTDRLRIVVIDNNSTDGTGSIARTEGARVIQSDARTIGAVRNAGLRVVDTPIVAFVDGDCTVPRGWLRSAVQVLSVDAQVAAVGGMCVAPTSGGWVERVLAPTRPPDAGVQIAVALATSSLIAKTNLLRECGLFNEALLSGEDDDLSLRLRQRGYDLLSSGACYVVHHGYPKSLWEVASKEFWHGSNQLETARRFDRNLAATVLFAVAFPACLFVFAWSMSAEAAVPVTVWVGLGVAAVASPTLFALKMGKRGFNSENFWRRWIVGCAYYAGRAAGLYRNVLGVMRTAVRRRLRCC